MASAVLQNIPETKENDLVMKVVTDLSAKLYCFVKGSTVGQVALAGSGDTAIGVLQNAPKGASGAPVGAEVRTGGLTRILAGGAISAGQFLKPNTDGSGSAIVATTNHDVFGAQALEDGTTGDYVAARVVGGTISAA